MPPLPPPLACPVRGCGRPLVREARTWRCPAGHAFDVARRGYVNLLQPQDRRAAAPGDAKAMVEARARLIAAGIGTHVIGTVAGVVADLALPDGSAVVELGAGTGDLLGTLAAGRAFRVVGIDLSTAAVEGAARRFPEVTWVVANADRRLPIADASVDLLLSVHARRNPAECARVLKPGGRLVVAVPAEDDLIELRAVVQGRGVRRERMAALLAEHQPWFSVADRRVARERRRLSKDHLRLLLQATYRGARPAEAARLDALDALDVTLASDLGVLTPIASRPEPHASSGSSPMVA